MNFKFGLLGFVVVAVFLAGCNGSEAKDCGNDIQCFAAEAETCSPAKVTMDFSGMGLDMAMYIEISGGSVDACNVYYKYIGGPMDGKDMSCTMGANTGMTEIDPEDMCNMCSGSLLQGIC